MWFILLIRRLRGCLTVEFSGDSLERIFGLCAKNRITLWDITKKKEKISCCVSIDGFRKLRKALRKHGIRVHILNKIGLPFYIKKQKNRLGFLIGILLFAAILFTLQGRVWNIEISGIRSIDKQEILDACEKNNIVVGGRKNNINTDESALNMSIEIDGISWVAVNIEGATVSVEIREENEAEFNTESAPSNLVAAYDGIVKSVEIISGFGLVKPGDSVARGDVLAKGMVELATGAIEFVNSSGRITAQTNRDITVNLPISREANLSKDRVMRCTEISFFGISIPLFWAREEPSIVAENSKIAYLNKNPLPIGVKTRTILPVKKQKITMSNDELLLEARGCLNRVISALDAQSVEVLSENISEENGQFCLTWTISAVENIVYEQKLEFFSSNS